MQRQRNQGFHAVRLKDHRKTLITLSLHQGYNLNQALTLLKMCV